MMKDKVKALDKGHCSICDYTYHVKYVDAKMVPLLQMWNCKSTTLTVIVELQMLAATYAVQLQMCQQHMWLAGYVSTAKR